MIILLVVLLATINSPARYGDVREDDWERMAARGATVIALQEVRDRDPRRLKPAGWGHYRPTRARSAAVIWDRSEWRAVKRVAIKLDRHPKAPDRYLVWVHLRHRETGERVRFASVHLPAWPYPPGHPRFRAEWREGEHARQTARVARWLGNGPNRVVGCDCNSDPRHPRLKALREVAVHTRADIATFGRSATLDSLWIRKGKGTWGGRQVAIRQRGSDHRGLLVPARVDSGT